MPQEATPEMRQKINSVYNRLIELGELGFGIVCVNPFDYMTVRKIGRDRMHITSINPLDGYNAQLLGQVIPPGEFLEAALGSDERKGPVCSGVWVCQNASVAPGSVKAAARLGSEWEVLSLEPA